MEKGEDTQVLRVHRKRLLVTKIRKTFLKFFILVLSWVSMEKDRGIVTIILVSFISLLLFGNLPIAIAVALFSIPLVFPEQMREAINPESNVKNESKPKVSMKKMETEEQMSIQRMQPQRVVIDVGFWTVFKIIIYTIVTLWILLPLIVLFLVVISLILGTISLKSASIIPLIFS